MPRRKRISKRKDDLTLDREWLLTIGPLAGPEGAPDSGPRPYPAPGSDEWEVLRACWFAHRDDLVADADHGGRRHWGHRVFEVGEDPRDVSHRLVPVDTDEPVRFRRPLSAG